jgi:hypothetical protein
MKRINGSLARYHAQRLRMYAQQAVYSKPERRIQITPVGGRRTFELQKSIRAVPIGKFDYYVKASSHMLHVTKDSPPHYEPGNPVFRYRQHPGHKGIPFDDWADTDTAKQVKPTLQREMPFLLK